MQIFTYVLARFSEPSSYAGLGAVLALLGVHFSDSDLGQIAQFLAAGCGLAALLLKERGIIQMLALAVLAAATLSACSGASALTPSQIASGTQQALATTQAILTTTQQAMCEAQTAANVAGAVAAGAGDAAAASEASKASAAAGAGCTWTNPATSSASAVNP
jgi:hypothetical protein